ncbi:MAG: lipopolysaccharide/colanic/teichoic acid biosynthesis glycosyltransferase [Candidatus Woesearchaeota archaeon]|jgi:lipopolysaccharide/colanic/teichoic acid biosynthesis glycosyltransferase
MKYIMGSFIYIRKCFGKNKRNLKLYKLRTMKLNADKNLKIAAQNGFDGLGKPVNDKRITFFGKFLRRYWIDELPQLYNFFKGDIKLVGIRPLSEAEWERYPPALMIRALKQKPGLMGFQYAYKKTVNFQSHLKQLEDYLHKWEQNPKKTDRHFFFRITKNILFKGVRSR